jgi:hypothetical protein
MSQRKVIPADREMPRRDSLTWSFGMFEVYDQAAMST